MSFSDFTYDIATFIGNTVEKIEKIGRRKPMMDYSEVSKIVCNNDFKNQKRAYFNQNEETLNELIEEVADDLEFIFDTENWRAYYDNYYENCEEARYFNGEFDPFIKKDIHEICSRVRLTLRPDDDWEREMLERTCNIWDSNRQTRHRLYTLYERDDSVFKSSYHKLPGGEIINIWSLAFQVYLSKHGLLDLLSYYSDTEVRGIPRSQTKDIALRMIAVIEKNVRAAHPGVDHLWVWSISEYDVSELLWEFEAMSLNIRPCNIRPDCFFDNGRAFNEFYDSYVELTLWNKGTFREIVLILTLINSFLIPSIIMAWFPDFEGLAIPICLIGLFVLTPILFIWRMMARH